MDDCSRASAAIEELQAGEVKGARIVARNGL